MDGAAAYPFEYVIVFAEDVSTDLQEAVATALSDNGLVVQQVDCVQNGDSDYLQVSATFEVMWQTSATLALPLTQPVEPSQLRGLDDLSKKRLALSSSERVQVVETLINAVKLSESTMSRFSELQNGVPGERLVARLVHEGVLEDITPVHHGQERMRIWQKAVSLFEPTPVHEVRNYYGEKVAFYFAWMSFFQRWLVLPAVLGLLLYGYGLWASIGVDDNPWVPLYSLFVTLWGALFLKYWVRETHNLGQQWDITIKRSTHVRPEFRGSLRVNPVTGQKERHYPAVWRYPWYLLSTLVSLGMLGVAMVWQVCSLNLQGYIILDGQSPLFIPQLDALSAEGALFDANSLVMWLIPCVGHSLVVMGLNFVYSKVAYRLTIWENHRHDAEFQNALILKRVAFEAMDAYMGLFYIAFWQMNISNLRNELMSLYCSDEIRRLMTESLIPWLMACYSQRGAKKVVAAKDPVTGKPVASAAAVLTEVGMDEYESFDDFLEMVIEYGYITLFASAFPLCAALSVMSNFVEMRSDAFKLSFVMRRPHSTRALGIGSWLTVMQLMTVAAIVTNCFLFGFASDQMEAWFPTWFRADKDSDFGQHIEHGKGRYIVLVVFLLEHIVLAFHGLVHYCIQDKPREVRVAEAKKLFLAEQKEAQARAELLGGQMQSKQRRRSLRSAAGATRR